MRPLSHTDNSACCGTRLRSPTLFILILKFNLFCIHGINISKLQVGMLSEGKDKCGPLFIVFGDTMKRHRKEKGKAQKTDVLDSTEQKGIYCSYSNDWKCTFCLSAILDTVPWSLWELSCQSTHNLCGLHLWELAGSFSHSLLFLWGACCWYKRGI